MTQEELNQKLFDTVYDKNIDGVREVLSLGADVNSADGDGWTVLIYACANGYTDIAKLLLEYGANINMVSKYGNTALMTACWNGYTDTVKLLLEHGVDINIQGNNGYTPLIYAAWDGYIDIAELLIEHGANINIRNSDGHTALDILKEEYPDKYKKLIKDMVIKARKDQLNTEDSLNDPKQEQPVDWNI